MNDLPPQHPISHAQISAVFLDRDGVINRDSPDYVRCWDDFEFLPRSIAAIARLTRAGIRVVVITNQSIVGRGWVAPEILEDTHARMCSVIETGGGRIEAIYHCPHHPDDRCACRKPQPGMILRAAAERGIDLSRAVMIGDSAKDIFCARNAGCGRSVLVKSGDYPKAAAALSTQGIAPDRVALDLWEAVDGLLAEKD
ncbi:MAG: D-glycero-beta-D-manno-heptose 1,7-bisphosphate 7-phosphatase [Pseudomonadota bacterium]